MALGIRLQLLGWRWKNTACRQILVHKRLQHASGFSNALILAAVCTECTRVIRCRKILQTGSHKSIGSRKEKDVVGQLSIAFQNLPRVSVSTKL